MGFTDLLVHDVTILHPDEEASRYGDELKDWDDPTATDVKGWIAQTTGIRFASEVLGEREEQVSEWVLFVMPSVTITGGDRVQWAGKVYEVDGEPNHAWTPRGEHHIEAPLKLVTGEWRFVES